MSRVRDILRRTKTSSSKQSVCNGVRGFVSTLFSEVVASVFKGPYLHHPATIMLLTCRGFATSRPTVHFISEKRSMPPIFPFLGAARSGRVPTSTVNSLTLLLMFSW